MSDETNTAERADGFIAVRKSELAETVARESGGSSEDATSMSSLFELLGALLHYEAHRRLEALKALYDAIEPDAPASRRDVSVAAFERFEQALSEALTRANFVEIEPHSMQTLETTKRLTGLAIKPSGAGIRRIRYFARGSRDEQIVQKTLTGKRVIDVQILNDVIVLVGFKAEDEIGRDDRRAFSTMRRGVRPGAALVKHFRNVANAELITLHPGAKPGMLRRDQLFLAAPAMATGIPVLLNLWPALGVIFAVFAAYFGAQGAIEDDALKRALAAMSGLIAVGAFIMRQRLKYEATSLRYQKKLADTIYFRNLANNAGVLDLLIGAGEEQDSKEAILAYAMLRRAGQPMVKADIDKASETFLRARFGLQINFEIQDAPQQTRAPRPSYARRRYVHRRRTERRPSAPRCSLGQRLQLLRSRA